MRAQEGAVKVDLDDTLKFFLRRFGYGAVSQRWATGVFVQHVQAYKRLNYGGDGIGYAGPVSDIGRHKQGIAVAIAGRRLGQLDGFGAEGAVDLGNHHFGACLREAQGSSPADAATVAGDEFDFPCETAHDQPLRAGVSRLRLARPPMIKSFTPAPSSRTAGDTPGG